MRLLFCGLLAVLPAICGNKPVAAPVFLYEKSDQSNASEPVMRAMRTELAAVMEPLGFQFEWRHLANNHGSEVVSELAVITFHGRCDIDGLTAHSIVPSALGWTHVSDGIILPFSEVDCDRVRNFVQRQLLSAPAALREELMGKALGRVLAHELYHVFGHTSHHAANGVAKASYTVADLLSPAFQFEKLEPGVMRAIVRELPPAPPAADTHMVSLDTASPSSTWVSGQP